MNNSSIMLLRPLSIARAGLACALVTLLVGTTTPQAVAQSDNFNDGNDTGWTRYALPAYGAPTYSYPADDTGGLAYRIYAPPTGADPGGMGNARAGSFRLDGAYSQRFSAGTDLLAWNASWRQEAGLLFFMTSPGLGTTAGYTATYSSGYRQL